MYFQLLVWTFFMPSTMATMATTIKRNIITRTIRPTVKPFKLNDNSTIIQNFTAPTTLQYDSSKFIVKNFSTTFRSIVTKKASINKVRISSKENREKTTKKTRENMIGTLPKSILDTVIEKPEIKSSKGAVINNSGNIARKSKTTMTTQCPKNMSQKIVTKLKNTLKSSAIRTTPITIINDKPNTLLNAKLTSKSTLTTVKRIENTLSIRPLNNTISAHDIDEASNCKFNGNTYNNSSVWIYRALFNVTCENGVIKVLNCITALGTSLALGTRNFVEADGYHYDCKLHTRVDVPQTEGEENNIEKNSEEIADFVAECDKGASAYVRAGFMVSCEREIIIGCVDAYGDLIRAGHYVLSGSRLRNCVLTADGRQVTSEWRGCFNGTRDDDPDEDRFRVPFGSRWFNGEFVLECGAEGFFVRQCRVSQTLGKNAIQNSSVINIGLKNSENVSSMFVESGTGWIDVDGVFNVCQ